MPDFEFAADGAFVLRVRLTHDAGQLYAAALRRGWSVEGLARQIVISHVEAERILATYPEPEEPLS